MSRFITLSKDKSGNITTKIGSVIFVPMVSGLN